MRRRLVALVAATTALVALAFLLPLGVLVGRLAEDRALRPAELATRSVAPVVALAPRDALAAVVEASSAGAGGRLGVTLPDDVVVGAPPAGDAVARARASLAEERADVDGVTTLALPVVTGDGTAVVHATLATSSLRQGVAAAWALLAALGLVLVGVAVALADRLARQTLDAVRRLEAAARSLGRGDLDARAEVEGPHELAAVGDVLADLAERIEDLLLAERSAAADLSHRLRTPLTPLRVDVDALPPSPQRDRLVEHVDVLERSVTDVIAAMRSGDDDPAPLADLVAAAGDRTAFWSALAQDEGRPFDVRLPSDAAPVRLGREDLEDLLDVLLDNAFGHTPSGTAVAVHLEVREGWATLVVRDHGPGLPPGTDVTRRGESGSGSSGIGLDIVRRLARRAGGRLAVQDAPGGGALARVSLPVVEQA